GDGDGNGNGSMLAFDLLRDRIVWEKAYRTGIDSMAITHDGRTIYMPVGELNPEDSWEIIDARTGRVTGRIHAGAEPHNTMVGLSGKYVYLSPQLAVARRREHEDEQDRAEDRPDEGRRPADDGERRRDARVHERDWLPRLPGLE